MSPVYLLDTNILSDMVRNPAGPANIRLALVGANTVVTSVIVAGELRHGARRSGSATLTAKVEGTLDRIPVAGLDGFADQIYAEVRTALEAAGTPISANDMWIASHAIALNCILVTANEREFRRVPGLVVENWLG